ncbi:glycosyl transferase family 1 [candidate division KSB3 bacterium]|uniref:Glycosyl transferase family 1 n=1 Tax=candidate division KSB3 bacterium TaxID=2044937 RepID=A0A2G6EDY0_9BACT|nr:MAG: glycosyl transferase family 1 [candidate division KSB3 bacterium]
MMNVLFDHQIFEAQQFGGISRYFYELWRHAEDAGFSAQIEVQYGKNVYLRESAAFQEHLQPFEDPWRIFFEHAHLPGKEAILRIKQRLNPGKPWKAALKASNQLAVLERLQHSSCDIFHPTYYDPYFLDRLHDTPFVLTVFDMIHERYPEYFRLTERVSAHKYRICQSAARIITISEQTRRDLISFFGIAPEIIDVVYLANSLVLADDELAVKLPDFYLLFTGSRKIYKNFYFLLRALADILRDNNITLVCTGKAFSAAEYQFFELLGVENHVRHISADDNTLAALYHHALAFVFPSLYEGFGIPVLEAFACGCPAILSNSSSLPEVGGDAAAYFEAKDARSIQEAVTRVIFHEELRRELIAKGTERLQHFSWERTARQTATVYARALNAV